ncbi:SsgA family sporulation/cell division regulator [Streptomyces kunmingensis]|uniref:SsgA family sporulation/cell division regulator n=1 Tax=Streptomyces kunmingensis TaxID=68225 RepID=A0ABU6C3F0_9ACTN|nr:SsgA family sporulation/cell division regulator [Streptomyces kunmingensis]MEB3959243.1 SsgA family sporulation/cell division regulator [Streptomyces kunmingensis]
MNKSHLALTITRWLGGDHIVEVPCEFSYDAGDPLAVTVTFTVGQEWSVRWVIARELLAEGLVTRSGDGDVALWPVYGDDGEPVTLGMRLGGTNIALFEIPVEPITQWLAQTYALVAPGAEFDGVNWDELLQPAE